MLQKLVKASSPEFVRILEPADLWTRPESCDRDARRDSFRGKVGADISVAMCARCPPLRVLAAFNGARRDVVLNPPAYYRFTQSDVEAAGGALQDTDANPPWPADYNHAHHDVIAEHDAVAERMARLHADDASRVVQEDETEVLLEIARLLSAPDVHKQFEKNATYRFRRMFTEGRDQRRLWVRVATHHQWLAEEPTVLKELRRMYQDLDQRPVWSELMDEIGIPHGKRKDYGAP